MLLYMPSGDVIAGEKIVYCYRVHKYNSYRSRTTSRSDLKHACDTRWLFTTALRDLDPLGLHINSYYTNYAYVKIKYGILTLAEISGSPLSTSRLLAWSTGRGVAKEGKETAVHQSEGSQIGYHYITTNQPLQQVGYMSHLHVHSRICPKAANERDFPFSTPTPLVLTRERLVTRLLCDTRLLCLIPISLSLTQLPMESG